MFFEKFTTKYNTQQQNKINKTFFKFLENFSAITKNAVRARHLCENDPNRASAP